MRRYLSVLFILITTVSFGQVLTENQKLAATARIWGFLKYYHPAVAEGKYDWDAELFKILPEVDNASTREDLSGVFLNFINNLGTVKVCKKCSDVKPGTFEKNFSLAWMSDKAVFTEAVTEKLKYIEANRHLGQKYYAGRISSGQVDVKNEKEYPNIEYPSEEHRLLYLFRYWNLIEYFFPYKYQTDQKWDAVLYEMTPRFRYAENATEYHLSMLELVAKIDDSHAFLRTMPISDYFGKYWAPFQFKIIDGNAVVYDFYNDTLAKKDDIRIGDVITEVNGIPVDIIFKQRLKYVPASNIDVKQRDFHAMLFNGPDDKVTITFERDGVIATKNISRYPAKELNYKWQWPAEQVKVLNGNIGYIVTGMVQVKQVETVMKTVENCKALILDLRTGVDGALFTFGRHLLPEEREFSWILRPDFDYPGKYLWDKDRQTAGAAWNKNRYKGKIILLVNERTQSEGEYTTMLLQAGDNVTTIGSRTSGADGNVSRFRIGGYETMFSGIGIFYPDGTETQRKGIKVDIEVKPTVAGIRSGTDEVLEKAIELANTP